ncbi:inositol-3-phosphate synthase [Micromonospora sp. M12]
MRTGVWLVGARGSVATTSIVGARAASRPGRAHRLRHRASGPARSRPAGLRRPGLRRARPGHHPALQARRGAGRHRRHPLAAGRRTPGRAGRGRPGAAPAPVGGTQAERAALVVQDLTSFRERHGLDRVVVVNVSATEPAPAAPRACRPDSAARRPRRAGRGAAGQLLYAYAAVLAGCPYVDFTLHRAAAAGAGRAGRRGPPAVRRARRQDRETLVKSVLAPMFAMRNLAVGSWSGVNLLGGGDGATLADPAANAAKVQSKQRVLGETLGYVRRAARASSTWRSWATSRPPGI